MTSNKTTESPQQVIDRVNRLAETVEEDVQAIETALSEFWATTDFIRTDLDPDWDLFAHHYLDLEKVLREKVNGLSLPSFVDYVRKNEAAHKANLRHLASFKAREFVRREWAM